MPLDTLPSSGPSAGFLRHGRAVDLHTALFAAALTACGPRGNEASTADPAADTASLDSADMDTAVVEDPTEDCASPRTVMAYVDEDGDGYGTGEPVSVSMDCGALPEGYALKDGDCSDGDSKFYPGQAKASGSGTTTYGSAAEMLMAFGSPDSADNLLKVCGPVTVPNGGFSFAPRNNGTNDITIDGGEGAWSRAMDSRDTSPCVSVESNTSLTLANVHLTCGPTAIDATEENVTVTVNASTISGGQRPEEGSGSPESDTGLIEVGAHSHFYANDSVVGTTPGCVATMTDEHAILNFTGATTISDYGVAVCDVGTTDNNAVFEAGTNFEPVSDSFAEVCWGEAPYADEDCQHTPPTIGADIHCVDGYCY